MTIETIAAVGTVCIVGWAFSSSSIKSNKELGDYVKDKLQQQTDYLTEDRERHDEKFMTIQSQVLTTQQQLISVVINTDKKLTDMHSTQCDMQNQLQSHGDRIKDIEDKLTNA